MERGTGDRRHDGRGFQGGSRPLLRLAAVALIAGLGLSCTSTIKPYEGGPIGSPEGGPEAGAAATGDQGENAGLKRALTEVVRAQVRAQGAPGIQASLRVGDQVVHVAVGHADSRRRVPLRPDHILRVGSVTKIFTAAVVLRLVESDLLSLEDTVGQWFALLPYAERISVRSLLNHTSGVFDYTQDRTFQTTTALFARKRWEPEELYRVVLRGQPSFPPGERYQYSNSNYLLLGMIAEKVSGRSYGELLQEGVLAPAGLTHTVLLPAEETPAGLISGYDRDVLAADLTRIRPGNRAWASGAFAAGGVASTSADLLSLIDNLFYGQLLTAVSLEEMTDFRPAPDEHLPAQTGYGLGLRRLEIEGDVLVGHTGTIPGFGAVVVECQERDYSIAAAANLSVFDQLAVLEAVVRLVHASPEGGGE
jgi:D-alanyl-D-alanine carboxypeptidase